MMRVPSGVIISNVIQLIHCENCDMDDLLHPSKGEGNYLFLPLPKLNCITLMCGVSCYLGYSKTGSDWTILIPT